MTVVTRTICDCCGEVLAEPPGQAIMLCVDDGVYRHLHLGCLQKNITRYLQNCDNLAHREMICNVLIHGK